MVVKSTSKGKAPGKARTVPTEMSALAQAIIRSVGVGIYIVQHGNFVYASPLFQELAGYGENKLLGKYSLEHVYPDDREMVSSIIYQGERAAVGSFMDITERKNLEEALRKSEERYRLTADNSGDFVWLVDTHGHSPWNSALRV